MNTSLMLPSREVATRLNITLRKLQWWDERGIVIPHHEGHRRLYSRRNLIELRLITELRRRGYSMRVANLLFRKYRGAVGIVSEARGVIYVVVTESYLDCFSKPLDALDAIERQKRPVALIKFQPEVQSNALN